MDLFDLVAKISLDTSEYENGLEGAEKKGSGFASKLGGALKAGAKAGVAALAAGSAAVSAFAASSVKTGISFDTSMSQIAATLGLTVDDINNNVNGAGDTFDALRAKALEMGSATNFSADQAADGLNILAMSGFSAEESMSMIEDVLHLAAAGSMDLASAAGYVSGAMKGFSDDTKDAGYYADLMAKGATLADTSVQELGEAMSSGAAGAAAYNQSANSMTVALLRLAEQGESGAAAGTALAAAMKNIYTPTDQAKKALKALGIAAYDENGAARDFNTVVDELTESLSGMNDEQANTYKQTIFGIQGLDAYNKMAVTTTEKTNGWRESLATASEGMGEAAKQYETMTDNLQGDIDILNSAINVLKIAVSDKLTPTIREFVQFGSDSFSRLTKAFTKNGLSGAMDEFGKILSEGVKMIVDMLPDIISAGAKLIKSFGEGIINNLPLIANTAVEIIMTLVDNISSNGNIKEFINAGFAIIQSLATSLSKALPELIPAVVDIIFQIVDALTDPENLKMLIEAALKIIIALAEGIIKAIPKLLEAAVKLMEKFTEGIVKAIVKVAEAGKKVVTGFIDGVKSWFNQIKDVGKQIIDKVKDGISGAFESFKNAVSEKFSSIKDAITQPFESAYEWVKGVVDKLKNIFNFSWSLPKIKLPHFKVTPAGWKFGDLLKGSIPRLSIEWYKKAYDEPYLFDKPTVVNARGFGDGNGSEFVYGRDNLMRDIQEAVGLPNVTFNIYQRAGEDSMALARRIEQDLIRLERDRKVGALA